jgi:type II secretory pathway component GspD/PulD (secretin)
LKGCLTLAGLCAGLVLAAAQAQAPLRAPAAAATNAAAPATVLDAKPVEAGAGTNAATEAAAPAGTNALAGTNAVAGTNAPAAAGEAPGASAVSTNSDPPITVADSAGGIMFNFHGAPLSLVLETMSDAAGFIINNQAESLRGSVEVWSKKPVSKDEAVELLDSVLRKNKYALTRNDRILTIFSLESAKTSSELGVRRVKNLEDVEPTDEIGTYVIPISYISAAQLKANLAVLLPFETELSVNESANSLVMVATGRDVRRALKIVNALDTSASNNSIRVFKLQYADARQLATEITALFSQNQQGMGGVMGRAMAFGAMMGAMRGGGGMGGMPGGANASPAGARVAATSDDYSNALIVSASKENMETIAEMIEQVDVKTTDITEVRIFHLRHADPNQLADQLGQLFPDTSRTDTGPGFGFRFGGPGGPFGFGGRGNTATRNTRDMKMSQVLAVPEPRTRSILVSAAAQLMPHIAEMIEQLDTDARHEIVRVFELANADPQDVYQVLQDLFQRSGNIRQNNNNQRNSMMGTGNPLTQRETQNQQNSLSSQSSFGGSSGRGGGGGGLGGGGGMGF